MADRDVVRVWAVTPTWTWCVLRRVKTVLNLTEGL